MDFGINIVTDRPIDYAVRVAQVAEKLGFKSIWIGETLGLKHPFKYIHHIAERTRRIIIGTSILSIYTNSVKKVSSYFANIVEIYGQRFIIGLGIGDKKLLEKVGVKTRNTFRDMVTYVDRLEEALNKRRVEIPIIIGSMGPKLVQYSCKVYGSILLNTVHPDYVKWVLRNLENNTKCKVYSIGPCLLEGDKNNLKAVKIAAALVLRGMNKYFLEEFKLNNLAKELDKLLESGKYDELDKYEKFLLDNFSIYGTLEQVLNRVKELENAGVKHLVFGTPLYRNIGQIEVLGKALNLKQPT